MSSLNDISNLNESLSQGGKYTSNKSDLLGSFTELQENANEVIHSTIEQFLPDHFDAVDPSGAFHEQAPVGVDDVEFENKTSTDISLNILIDNFKSLAGDFRNALTALSTDAGYVKTNGGSGTYDLSFGYTTGAIIDSKLGGYTDYSDAVDADIYFVSRVNDSDSNDDSSFQYSKLIADGSSIASAPSDFIDNSSAPDHLQLTCGNLPMISADANFWTVAGTGNVSTAADKGNTLDNTGVTGDRLAIDDQKTSDVFDTASNLQAAGRRMCNPYNIIQDNISVYGSNAAGEKFAKVTYLATKITALVKEINRRIEAGDKITDADGNEIALTLEQLDEKYKSILAENANVDANLETESLKFDSENLLYIGMLVATVTAMAVGFTSLAIKTDMS